MAVPCPTPQDKEQLSLPTVVLGHVTFLASCKSPMAVLAKFLDVITKRVPSGPAPLAEVSLGSLRRKQLERLLTTRESVPLYLHGKYVIGCYQKAAAIKTIFQVQVSLTSTTIPGITNPFPVLVHDCLFNVTKTQIIDH